MRSGLAVRLHVGVPPLPPPPPPVPVPSGLIAIESVFDAVLEPLSVTVTVNGYVPSAVGVPEITPVPAFKLRPAGRLPDDHVYGVLPPVALSVVLGYA